MAKLQKKINQKKNIQCLKLDILFDFLIILFLKLNKINDKKTINTS